MTDVDLPPELSEECLCLEQLIDHVVVRPSEDHRCDILVELLPRVTNDLEVFVSCSLELAVPENYPETPVAILLKSLKGLDESLGLEIIDLLTSESNDLASNGCPSLISLVELGKDLLTEKNTAQGDCMICMCSFEEDEIPRNLVRTSCFHFFHKDCLFPYFTSLRNSYIERELGFVQEYGALVYLPLRSKRLAEAGNRFFLCPLCRSPITLEEISQFATEEELSLRSVDEIEALLSELEEKYKAGTASRPKGSSATVVPPEEYDAVWLSMENTRLSTQPRKNCAKEKERDIGGSDEDLNPVLEPQSQPPTGKRTKKHRNRPVRR
eukprot:GCRY01005050.1.p1 GENE.GCRY01005050.1~~GCRY01005050.1.p1  ORF type:complete len:325 (-),score=36.83 GCRY01005050.1:431-1405(-)